MIMACCLAAIMAAAPPVAGAFQKDLKSSQSQLEKLRSEIREYEKKIQGKEKKENVTLEQLDNYNRQETLLKRLIGRLHREEAALESSIDSAKNSVSELKGRIEHLKQEYAGYVRSAYIRGQIADLELLASSGSLNQLFIRAEYLKRFSDRRRLDLAAVAEKKAELEEQQEALEKKLSRQKSVISDKSAEQGKLRNMTKRKKSVLAAIRRDKKNYQKEIDRRKKDFQEVERKKKRRNEKPRQAGPPRRRSWGADPSRPPRGGSGGRRPAEKSSRGTGNSNTPSCIRSPITRESTSACHPARRSRLSLPARSRPSGGCRRTGTW